MLLPPSQYVGCIKIHMHSHNVGRTVIASPRIANSVEKKRSKRPSHAVSSHGPLSLPQNILPTNPRGLPLPAHFAAASVRADRGGLPLSDVNDAVVTNDIC